MEGNHGLLPPLDHPRAGPGACGPVGLIAENLQKKLEVEMEHAAGRAKGNWRVSAKVSIPWSSHSSRIGDVEEKGVLRVNLTSPSLKLNLAHLTGWFPSIRVLSFLAF